MNDPTPDTGASPDLGFLEWFHVGEYERADQTLGVLRELDVRHLRTGFSWADWHTEKGPHWYDWLLPRLAREVQILPCFHYTPPSLGLEAKVSAPPREPKEFADFLDQVIARYGRHFDYVELWNEPNNLSDWDWRLDPDWETFTNMIGMAAHWCRRRGKRTVLGGMSPTDPSFLAMLRDRKVLDHIDVVGVHGFPGTWENEWTSWERNIDSVRQVLNQSGLTPEIWITEAGYSTWRHDEFEQLRAFANVLRAPAQRVYWYAVSDLAPERPHQNGFHQDERHYHFGIRRDNGASKLVHRVWREQGIEGVRAMNGIHRRGRHSHEHNGGRRRKRPVLITGGSGFIGTNLASRLLRDGEHVLVLDNLSRPGVERNLRWLTDTYGTNLRVRIGDVRDPLVVRRAVREASAVFHLAAQVAVTTSLDDPQWDFDVNVRGTFNVLHSLRELSEPPPLLFTSTNKVYGSLNGIELHRENGRYVPNEFAVRERGIGERQPLDFHSPYGCSKGAADQYVLDFARCYRLPAVVFRMSCIYGPHQFGTEDQGWVAHFLIRALAGQPIVLYGDGHQVRDLLFVEDLVDAMLRARDRAHQLAGRAFNMGGGTANSVSLLELLDLIAQRLGRRPEVRFGSWRQGDQKYYITDTRTFRTETGWAPQVDVRAGLERLHRWLASESLIVPARLPGLPRPVRDV